MNVRRVVVLGATGSVGRSTLDVMARHERQYQALALTAHRDVAGLTALCLVHRPEYAVVADEACGEQLRNALRAELPGCRVLHGAQGYATVAALAAADVVVCAIVGAAGLLSTLAAVHAGKQVLIANKEPIVMAGRLLMGEARRYKAQVIPLDSEHNAIFQCLPSAYRCGEAPKGVRRVILTASGGPFRQWSAEQLRAATPQQAVRHPNWSMGPKISVDSATLMNKGLELIEAATLYDLPEERIDVVVHPESTVHSLVEYVDGSMLAQLGQPDMRIPIAHALAWPERVDSGVGGLDLPSLGTLHFEAPDELRFPCLRLARAALRRGGYAGGVLNAANEIAVEAFLKGRIGFMHIAQLIERCLDASERAGLVAADDLESVLAVDRWARQWSLAHVDACSGSQLNA